MHSLAKNALAISMLVERPLAEAAAGCCSVLIDAGDLVRIKSRRSQLSALDERVSEFLASATRQGRPKQPVLGFWIELKRPRLSPDGSRSFVVDPRRGLWRDGAYDVDGVYDKERRCTACDAGARQIGLLRLPSTTLGQVIRVCRTLSAEYLVDVEAAGRLIDSGLLTGHLAPVLFESKAAREGGAAAPLAELQLTVHEWRQQAMCAGDRKPTAWRSLGRLAASKVVQWLPGEDRSMPGDSTAYANKFSPWAPRLAQPACSICGTFAGNYRVGAMSVGSTSEAGVRFFGRATGFPSGLCQPHRELLCSERVLAKADKDLVDMFRYEECDAA